jgi:hypothetical protein
LTNDLEKSNKTTKQRSMLSNRFLISKYTQPLLGKAFASKHVPKETIGVQQRNGVFYAVHAGML